MGVIAFHVVEAQVIDTDFSVHVKQFVELAHFEEQNALQVFGFRFPPLTLRLKICKKNGFRVSPGLNEVSYWGDFVQETFRQEQSIGIVIGMIRSAALAVFDVFRFHKLVFLM